MFLVALIALGRWEYNLLRRRPNHGWLVVSLIALGYAVEKICWKFLSIIFWPLISLTRSFKRRAHDKPPITKSQFVQSSAKSRSRVSKIVLGFFRSKRNLEINKKTSADQAKNKTATIIWSQKDLTVLWRQAAVFAAILLMIVLPLKFYGHYQALLEWKDKIITVSRAAINDAWSGKEAAGKKDFGDANRQFSRASSDFLAAEAELGKVNDFLLSLSALVPSDQAKLASESKNILEAARLGSEIAADLTLAMGSLFGETADQDIVKALAGFNEAGARAQVKAEQLVVVLNKIKEKSLPENSQADFVCFRERSQFLAASLNELVVMSANLRSFLGETYDKRYLLVFQNKIGRAHV